MCLLSVWGGNMKKSVVIIEDEINIAKAEELILQEDYEVHLAHDGEAGLSKIREIKPDLVVLDWMLPKLSGVNVLQHVREDPSIAHTKIVMVTAKNQQEDEDKGMERGADDYIMKPFEPVELMHVINQVLNK